jgi:hypothetical protein
LQVWLLELFSIAHFCHFSTMNFIWKTRIRNIKVKLQKHKIILNLLTPVSQHPLQLGFSLFKQLLLSCF